MSSSFPVVALQELHVAHAVPAGRDRRWVSVGGRLTTVWGPSESRHHCRLFAQVHSRLVVMWHGTTETAPRTYYAAFWRSLKDWCVYVESLTYDLGPDFVNSSAVNRIRQHRPKGNGRWGVRIQWYRQQSDKWRICSVHVSDIGVDATKCCTYVWPLVRLGFGVRKLHIRATFSHNVT